jgi:hypothetical protein
MSYNKKTFIAPDSVSSMSAIHCKIQDDRAIVRLSDCHGSIKWHNSINEPLEVKEMLSKLRNAMAELKQFEAHLVDLYLTL